MAPKSVALIGAACLTSGWLLASLLSPPVARLQALPDRRAVRPAVESASAPGVFTEQLRLKLQQAPAAPVPRRNPFRFGSRSRSETSSARERRPESNVSLADLPLTPAIAPPIFALSGIAINEGAQGAIRTGILSDGKTVHLVKVGDTVAGYQVLDVTDSSVTLADASGAKTVLNLR